MMNILSTPKITPARFLDRLRGQLLVGILVTVLLPAALRHATALTEIGKSTSSFNTLLGTAVALIVGTYLFRRVTTFPGVRAFAYVMPSFGISYGLTVAGFFFLRLDYSRFYFFVSFVAALLLFFFVSLSRQGRVGQRFYVVPAGETEMVSGIPNVEWVFMREPSMPSDRQPTFVADLRADHGDQWERMIAEAAIAGHPVYHVKQLRESLTGRVEIEHLSENSFGSLLPNHSYSKVKRLFDFGTAVAVVPFLLVPAAIVAIAIKLDSAGPIFFRQLRMGYRGKTFHVIKFRTMWQRRSENDLRADAITVSEDSRITRVGQFLRRTRIDEIPQIVNVLAGDMSWIGPRPEAISLSRWYESEIPFYSYRHIVRPGITGWAQVNQGHVAELSAVNEKLHYDFYYIKNFSAWLDWLIMFKTVRIVITGFGAK